MDDQLGRQRVIDQFRKLLDSMPNDKAGVIAAMDFIYEAMRNKQGVLPMTEFITVLKHDKPLMFQHMRHAIAPTSRLYFVLQLEMDVQEAYRRLGWTANSDEEGES